MGLFDFDRRKDDDQASEAWQPSEAHLLLLTKFLVGQQLGHVAAPYWTDALGEAADAAIKRFIALGWLVPASLAAKVDSRFKASDLKPLLKDRGLKLSGRKPELIERLIAADEEGMAGLVANLDIYECSPEARMLAERYKYEQEQKRAEVEAKVLAKLRVRDFLGASATVAEYESEQVFQRGLGMDWKNHNLSRDAELLNVIFGLKPQILDGLAQHEWEPLAMAAGMMALWGTNTAKAWLPGGFVGVSKFDADTAVRMLLFAANHRMKLAEYRELSKSPIRVRQFEISATADSCAICAAMAGKRFRLGQIPELPHPACTHPYGCRCMAMPVFVDR